MGLAYLTGASNEDKKVKEYKNSANIVIAGVLAYNMSWYNSSTKLMIN